jgi:hypothetical protein
MSEAYGVKLVRGPFVTLAPHPEAVASLEEVVRGDGPTAVDLFCGAGGLSLGLEGERRRRGPRNGHCRIITSLTDQGLLSNSERNDGVRTRFQNHQNTFPAHVCPTLLPATTEFCTVPNPAGMD